MTELKTLCCTCCGRPIGEYCAACFSKVQDAVQEALRERDVARADADGCRKAYHALLARLDERQAPLLEARDLVVMLHEDLDYYPGMGKALQELFDQKVSEWRDDAYQERRRAAAAAWMQENPYPP